MAFAIAEFAQQGTIKEKYFGNTSFCFGKKGMVSNQRLHYLSHYFAGFNKNAGATGTVT